MDFDINTSMSLLVFLGALTPFVTAFLTRLRDPEWFKGVVSITTAAAVGAFAAIQGVGLDAVAAGDIVQHSLAVWAVHLMTYFGVSKEMVAKAAKATVSFAPIALKRGA